MTQSPPGAMIRGVVEASLVTILFTDIVGSASLYERLGDDEADARRIEHFATLRAAIARHDGREVKSVGDGLMVAFSSTVGAVRCAIEMQRATTGAAGGLPLRIGIDAGEPIAESGDLFGTPVIIASRLCNAAEPGGVLTTEVVHRIAGPRVGGTMRPAGSLRVKGIAEPVATAVVGWRDEEQHEPGDARSPTRAAEHKVPVPLSSLIGRTRELDAVAETLRRSRLVTLAGPGGVGKTRLALELARRQAGYRIDGVWFVDLTAGPAPAAEVARTLEVGGRSTAPPTESLQRYLENRVVLLVLDNCEQVIEACAQLTADLLGVCGELRILATSREPLDVPGETVWRLEPLGPDDAERLFVERARQRRSDFMPGVDTEETIAAVCARVDRLPLAIELAAARIAVMSPAEILKGLEAQLGTLGGGSRLSPARHRTVRAIVEWSYELLDPDEQVALRNLAVFVGGFDADAATAVAPGLTVDLLARLVEKSLVAVSESPSGRTRYRLLETVREYAHELLACAGESDAARERHLAHFATLGDVEREGWPAPDADAFVNELEDDYENVRAALDWAAESDPCAAMQLLGATLDLFFMLGQSDGRRLAELMLERCPVRDRHRARVQITAGVFEILVWDAAAARDTLSLAAELCVELHEPGLEGYARMFRGVTDTLDAKPMDAREHLEHARALFQRSGRRIGEGRADAMLGLTCVLAGEPTQAKEYLDEALTIHAEDGNRWGAGQAHVYAGFLAESTGADPQRITDHHHKAVELLRPYRDATLLPGALIGQAAVLARHHPARALKTAAAATAIRLRGGGEFQRIYRERIDRIRATCTAATGTAADRVWTDGMRLTVDDAIALAFDTTRPQAPPPAGLSARELDVARLVATGMSNKAIAAELYLSVRTVESHVRNVLAKARLQNRTQIATWARDRI